jgi:probable HAF family extracellular repeat protein
VFDVILLDGDEVLHDLNNRGERVGQRVLNGAQRAVLRTDVRLIDLGTLGGSASSARGINDSGIVVGGALTKDDEAHHAFIYEAGRMRDLNTLISRSAECEVIQALGINDRGDILAIGHYQGTDRVVLLRRRHDRTA